MPTTSPNSVLAEISAAVGDSKADQAVEAALRGLRGGLPPTEVLHAAALAAAARFDPEAGTAPHGLLALSSAAGLGRFSPRTQALAVLQAVLLAASEPKSTEALVPPLVVAGEVTHLARSFVLAVRAGDLREAEAIFLGLVREGQERRMAGDALFRAAIEDMGDAGGKLLLATGLWRLARAIGFRDARSLLRPAVGFLVRGPRELRPFETVLGLLGRERVDLEALGSGGNPLDDAGRAELATHLQAPTPEACVAGILGLLREGYAASALSEGMALEAARRLLGAEGHSPEAIRALLTADACHYVLTFSRTGERLHALFASALRVRSPAPHLPAVAVPEPSDAAEGLRRVEEAMEARRGNEAAALTRAYLAHGHPGPSLMEALVHRAVLDSSLANRGLNLGLAEVCARRFAETQAREYAMALAKGVAMSPRDLAASRAWLAALGP